MYIYKAIDSGMNQVLSKPTPVKVIKDLMIKMKYIEDKPAQFEEQKATGLEKIIANNFFTTSHKWLK